MTGGQDAAGVRPVPDVAAMLLAEGVKRVVITTDDPGKYRGVSVPRGVDVMHRDRIVEAQEQLRAIDGVTVLIHDQQCAAEKRRERKRGRVKQASFRVMIDERVCEGCGDCGVKSNCLSLHSIDTEFGRKTVVDQASCNIDASCLKGDCPAFVTVAADSITGRSTGAAEPTPRSGVVAGPGAAAGVGHDPDAGHRRHRGGDREPGARHGGEAGRQAGELGRPDRAQPEGGSGRVDTVRRRGRRRDASTCCWRSTRCRRRRGRTSGGLDPATSVAIVSTSVAPTGRMIGKVASMGIDLDPVKAEIDARTVSASNRYVDAAGLTTGLFGNSVTANVFVVGVAYQAGLIPRAGRRDRAGDRAQRRRRRGQPGGVPVGPVVVRRSGRGRAAGRSHEPERRRRAVRRRDVRRSRTAAAGGGQGRRPRRVPGRQVRPPLRRGRAARPPTPRAAAGSGGGDGSFSRTVARQLHRLMAYKDEYEVARLLLDGRSQVREVFGDGAKATWNLHPPALRSMGLKRKIKFGPWTAPAMKGLRSMKRLRGTALDPFGRAEMRRTERALIDEYIALVRSLLPTLAADHARAVSIAGLADQIRGFESVKMRNVEHYREALAAATADV